MYWLWKKTKLNTPRGIFQLSWLFRYYTLLRNWEHLTSLQYQYASICATHLFSNWSKLFLAYSTPKPIIVFPLQQPLVYLRFHHILSPVLVQVTWSHSHFLCKPFQLLVDQVTLYYAVLCETIFSWSIMSKSGHFSMWNLPGCEQK